MPRHSEGITDLVGGPPRPPDHRLAGYGRPIPASELTRHIQLVLTDRSTLTKGQDLGVYSARTWRLADLGAKHEFLRAGLGWGGMPAELIQPDLARGTLVKIVAEDAPDGFVVAMNAVYRTDAPPGIAGRWFIDRLMQAFESRAPKRPAPRLRKRR